MPQDERRPGMILNDKGIKREVSIDMCTREKLANLCHEQWIGWMEYLFSKCFAEVGQFDKKTGNLIIPEWAVNKWRRQMSMPYAELPENEKESDRKEADRFLALLGESDS
jgi:hypothetical protein